MDALIAQLERRYPWDALRVDGHEWRWIDTAAPGAVAVLLPGSVGDGAMFVRTLLSLGERCRLIAVTYPALADPAALADGLAAVAAHLGLPDSVVVGSSFSAYWAQFYALRHPGLVRALVLGNGFVDASDLAANPLFDRGHVEAADPAALHAQWLARVEQAPPGPLAALQALMLRRRQTPENLHARFLGVVRAQACGPLPLAPQRITVLDCQDDPLIPPAARARVRRAYPDARHVTLDHGGHYPHVLNPQAYEDTLLGVLY